MKYTDTLSTAGKTISQFPQAHQRLARSIQECEQEATRLQNVVDLSAEETQALIDLNADITALDGDLNEMIVEFLEDEAAEAAEAAKRSSTHIHVDGSQSGAPATNTPAKKGGGWGWIFLLAIPIVGVALYRSVQQKKAA